MAADALELIKQQGWLDPFEEGVQKAVKKTFENGDGAARPIKSFLHGTWLGHALHPVLTDIPIGAWSTAVVMDALGEESGADAAIGIGLVGAVGAAATGLTDWSDTHGNDRRVGIVHGALNTVAAGLFGASLIARRRGSRATGQSLSLAGFAIVMASAWLGGELVYKKRVGVDRSTEVAPPEDWTAVLPETELRENTPKQADANGLKIFLLKRGNQMFALSDVCSHMCGPLHEGKLEGDHITCPWHGSTFDVRDGHVVNGPATQPVLKMDLRVKDGQIEVKAGEV